MSGDGSPRESSPSSSRLLVTGASGRIAALVLHELLDVRGVAAQRIIATTRTPERLSALAERGVDVRQADLDDPAGLEAAFSGADRALFVSASWVEAPATRLRQHATAVEAIARAQIEHVVYTSAIGCEPPNPMFWEADHWATEEAIRSAGCTWTMLRNSDYLDLPLEGRWAAAIARGTFHTSAGSGRCAWVTRADCARTAAAALDSASRANEILTVTGPRSLTMDEVMAALGDLAGRRIEVVHCGPEDVAREERDIDTPEWVIAAHIGLDAGIREGYFDAVTDDVERLTGAKPTTLETFLRSRPAVPRPAF